MTVRYDHEDPEGLASMLGGLIAQNLLRDPSRHRLLRAATVVVRAADAGVAVTIRIRPGEVLISRVTPRAQVSIAASGSDLLAMAGAPLRFGLPDPLRREGRAVLFAIATGRVRVRGLLRRLLVLRRFTMLLSAR
ncbi:MAG: hypothetical protein WD096_05240 [Actinomycetota bacterium]